METLATAQGSADAKPAATASNRDDGGTSLKFLLVVTTVGALALVTAFVILCCAFLLPRAQVSEGPFLAPEAPEGRGAPPEPTSGVLAPEGGMSDPHRAGPPGKPLEVREAESLFPPEPAYPEQAMPSSPPRPSPLSALRFDDITFPKASLPKFSLRPYSSRPPSPASAPEEPGPVGVGDRGPGDLDQLPLSPPSESGYLGDDLPSPPPPESVGDAGEGTPGSPESAVSPSPPADSIASVDEAAPASVSEARRGVVLESGTPAPAAPDTRYYVEPLRTSIVIHGPSEEPYGYTPLFPGQAGSNFCVCIAGTEKLGITGGGINGAMADAIVRQSRGRLTRRLVQQDTEMYHNAGVKSARDNAGSLVAVDVSKSLIYEALFAFCAKDTQPLHGVPDTVGVPLLGVLRPRLRIHADPRNMFVLYVVGPRGTVKDEDFFPAYAAAWKNSIQLVRLVNANRDSWEVDRVDRLRLPLLSAGIYAGGRSQIGLALEAVKHIAFSMKDPRDLPEVEFMYEPSLAFFKAWRLFVSGEGASRL